MYPITLHYLSHADICPGRYQKFYGVSSVKIQPLNVNYVLISAKENEQH